VRIDPQDWSNYEAYLAAIDKRRSLHIGGMIHRKLLRIQQRLTAHDWQRLLRRELNRETLQEILRRNVPPISEPEVRAAQAAARAEAVEAELRRVTDALLRANNDNQPVLPFLPDGAA
jgi:hypothetical protein